MSKREQPVNVLVSKAERWLASDSGKSLVETAIRKSQDQNEKDSQSLRVEVRDLYVPVTI